MYHIAYKGPFRSVNSEFFSNIARKKEKNTEIPKIISISSYRYENFPQIALQNCKKIIKWQK